MKRLSKVKDSEKYDFGWSSKWNKGFGFASFIVLLLSVYSYFGLAENPVLQFIAYTILLLLSVNFFIGNIIVRSSNSAKGIILPYVDLFNAGKNNVLDAGCGAGRTTISLSKAASDFTITAFDRFDAKYIDDGGRELFKRNIGMAGIESRVNIVQGDITAMPFKENAYDAAVSAYMFDHLGENKLIALNEMHRVLKTGGRFLLIIVVRGYSSFALANLMSLFFDSRNDWRKLFEQSGFILVEEGDINFGAYFLIEKGAVKQVN